MLLIMLFKALEAGEVKLDAEFLMSEHAWRTGGAPSRYLRDVRAARQDGQGRRAAQGHRRAIGQRRGDLRRREAGRQRERSSPRRMTEEARRLGLKKSVFKNATGLHDPDHLMTVRELAILARHHHQGLPGALPAVRPARVPLPPSQVLQSQSAARRGHRRRRPEDRLHQGVRATASSPPPSRTTAASSSPSTARRRAEERKDDARRLLDWGFKNFSEAQAVRCRRGRRPRPRLGRRAHVHAADRQRRRQHRAAALSRQPEARGPDLLQGPAEAAAQEGRAGRDPARHHRERCHQRGAALRGGGRGPGRLHAARA